MRTEFIVMQASASMPDSVNAGPRRLGAASTASPTYGRDDLASGLSESGP
jgi:hypothetical protein